MQFFSVDSDYVDSDLYNTRLNEIGHIYMDMISLGIYAQQQACLAETYYRLCKQFINQHSLVGYDSMDKQAIIDYLVKAERVSRESFRAKNVIGESIDKTKVLTPLRKNGYAPDFFDLYFQYVSSKSRNSNMSQFYDRNKNREVVEGYSCDLAKVPFTARVEVNLRCYYSSEDIIGIPKDISQVVQAPEGYVLAWGDFAQSDARIAFNTLLKDEATLPIVEQFPDDIYAGFARLVSNYSLKSLEARLVSAKQYAEAYAKNTGQVPDDSSVKRLEEEIHNFQPFTEFSSKSERELYKLNSLRTLYGTRTDSVRADREFISKFAAVLMNCPRYKEYWDDVSFRASFGLPLAVKCYMGHVEYVPAFDGKRISETLFKCLNYPVQGGSSEMIILTVNRLLDTFYSLGYGPEDVRIYYTRHDEPVFILKESVMKDSWIFKDFEYLQVDDWFPLQMDFSFGRKYTNVDVDLMEKYEDSWKRNESRIGIVSTGNHKEYWPLQKILVLGADVIDLGENSKIVSVYEEKNNLVDVFSVTSEGTPQQVLFSVVNKFLEAIHQRGYRQVVIYNELQLNSVDESGAINVVRVFKSNKATTSFRASIIARSSKAKLLGDTEVPVIEENREFLKSVGVLGLFRKGEG